MGVNTDLIKTCFDTFTETIVHADIHTNFSDNTFTSKKEWDYFQFHILGN